jgi:hypothetical protein
MWKKRRGLWVSDEVRQTAERPHWIAIGIGLLSPALAIVALFVSLQSLKIANLVQEKGPNVVTHCIVRMDMSAAILNAGNSPASVGQFTPRYRLPKGWSEAPGLGQNTTAQQCYRGYRA